MSRIGIIGKYQPVKGCGNIVVVSGGTSDMPVRLIAKKFLIFKRVMKAH